MTTTAPQATKFTTLTSTCVPLNANNLDTDQVIPARFLKGTTKKGLGEKLFHDLRYNADGSEKAEFELNQSQYKGGKILVSAHNFGCGSSREHAPWALKDYGFIAVIAISFADIFNNNSLKNGVLTIALPEDVVMKLLADVEADPKIEVTINLPAQVVNVPNQGEFSFEINSYRKECMVNGLDDVGYTLSQMSGIVAFEEARLKIRTEHGEGAMPL